ncbi:MAG TPA: XRE family transcriptional regulator, partial [Candidatus Acidoferrales bacterium]|nr:XRE family transcriptional regulator [Candidatus Acidoferrales bacterium]
VRSAANKPTHVTQGSVLDDLGFSPELATALKFKAELYQAILKYSEKYSRKELQAILREPQPRVSELLNGKRKRRREATDGRGVSAGAGA